MEYRKTNMRYLKTLLVGFWVLSAFAAMAQSRTVVVELYTSQGCNSCPPADEFLGELVKRDGVIALALHVDYWDYIGWKDQFAQKSFAKRQKAYARAAGRRMVYTPQIIVGGAEHAVGSDKTEVLKLIETHLAKAAVFDIQEHRTGNEIIVDVDPVSGVSGAMAVQLVKYHKGQTVNIGRGENAGKSIPYYNIVTEWKLIHGWDGKSALHISVNVKSDENAVIIVQDAPNGAILAARKLH